MLKLLPIWFVTGVIVLGIVLWHGSARADTNARRIDLLPSEQVQLVCPNAHQLVAMPGSDGSMTVSCIRQNTTQPTLAPSPGATTTPGGVASHPAGCKPGEVFHDSQDWWTHDDPERNFGHLHTQICFPVNARIDQPYKLTVTSLLHNNPGHFYRLMMQSYSGGLDGDDTICGDTTAVVCKTFSRSLERCEETGGELLDHGETCRWRDSFTIEPSRIGASGWQQFRFRAFVDEPDGTRMATSTSLHAEIVNDHPPSRLYQDYGTYNYLRGRGWYTDAQYAAAYLMDAEQLKRPIAGVWRPVVHFEAGRNHDGAPPAPVTGHFAALDTNFHAGQQGTVLRQGSGEYHGELVIDTTKLSNGWHRLFLKTDQAMPDGHTHSGVLAVWFEVKN